MWKTLASSIFCLVVAQGATLGQWTCDTATPVDLPYERTLETWGSDTFGYWNKLEFDRSAVVEVSGGPCGIPGAAIALLWSECRDGTPEGLVGLYQTPNMETDSFTSGEIALEPGAYYLEYKAFCVVDWDTWFFGTLRISARHAVDIEVKANVNPRSRGVVPVAILGSEFLDVSEIDVATLQFGPGGAATQHDLTDPWTYNEHLRDLNLDGVADLVVHFPTRDTGIACGDESAALSAVLASGQPVEGVGLIRTVGCRHR